MNIWHDSCATTQRIPTPASPTSPSRICSTSHTEPFSDMRRMTGPQTITSPVEIASHLRGADVPSGPGSNGLCLTPLYIRIIKKYLYVRRSGICASDLKNAAVFGQTKLLSIAILNAISTSQSTRDLGKKKNSICTEPAYDACVLTSCEYEPGVHLSPAV
jgi:hypothetical protein